MVANDYISSYDGLSVYQDEANPTQVNIVFEYVPIYGMNYIQISFSVDGSSTVA